MNGKKGLFCGMISLGFIFFGCSMNPEGSSDTSNGKPNIVLIYADDLGYGDLSCYGATKIHTPNIDKLADEGLLFTRAYASSSTCTPSRFSMMTGRYAFRQTNTAIAPGDAPLIIDPGSATLPAMLQAAGYETAAIGKWHLGLGTPGNLDWNGHVTPGPAEIGFSYSYLMPATSDRVPCVFMENQRVVDLDPNDPIAVSFSEKVGDWPTGKENPELMKMDTTAGHNNTIINGIGRIGYMTGGKSALWVDEEIAGRLVEKSKRFISDNQTKPFFLYLATNDIHVPRLPNEKFAGKSGMGPRGDVILQLDWTVGEIVKALDSLGISDNTMIVFTSDNGPIVDDGYADQAKELLNGHTPAGHLRGGKYSTLEGGTRVPMLIKWPKKVNGGKKTDALLSQVDFIASFASLVGQSYDAADAIDSQNHLEALIGESNEGRTTLVEDAINNVLSYVEGDWKYISPFDGPPTLSWAGGTESGFLEGPQLYKINEDPHETNNVADQYPEKVKEMQEKLAAIKQKQ